MLTNPVDTLILHSFDDMLWVLKPWFRQQNTYRVLVAQIQFITRHKTPIIESRHRSIESDVTEQIPLPWCRLPGQRGLHSGEDLRSETERREHCGWKSNSMLNRMLADNKTGCCRNLEDMSMSDIRRSQAGCLWGFGLKCRWRYLFVRCGVVSCILG